MSTELEKYLKINRPELDVESPDDNRIWNGISSDLGKKRIIEPVKQGARYNLSRLRSIAAMVTIILSMAYITYDIIGDRQGRQLSLNQVDSTLGEREQAYRNLVSFKQEELKSYEVPENEIISEIFAEIKIQDQIYEQAMKDLQEMGNDDQVINTIFDTYERKIQLLGLIIIETNKNRNYEKNDQSSL